MTNNFAPGSSIGDYILDAPIGTGGFGTVWRGHDQAGQTVAVKLLSAAFGSAETTAMRADIEVLAAAAAADSRHVVRVLGGGSDPVPHIVMEFIEGTDLHKRLAEQRQLSIRETIDVALAIFDALRALHDAGIIHRDIKPANVLIDQQGVIKLADFGIAKIVGYATLTVTAQTAMTMAYAAPELWDEKGALGGPSNKSDLYALGVLLYQCLVGALPFSGNFGALYRAHAEEAADFGALPADTPPSLRSVIRRCMAKPQADRPRDAAECLAVLERAEAELAQAGGEATREPSRFGPWIRESLHPTEPWAWRCRHETSGEIATVEVHFADSLDHANSLRRAVEASPRLSSLGAERLRGTNRLLLHPGEEWQAAPAGRFQFWVAREDTPPQPAATVSVALLRSAVTRLAALMAAAAGERLSAVSPVSDLTVRADGSIHLGRPGLDDAGVDPGESALAMLRRLPLDTAARAMLAAAPDFESLVAMAGGGPPTTMAPAIDPMATTIGDRAALRTPATAEPEAPPSEPAPQTPPAPPDSEVPAGMRPAPPRPARATATVAKGRRSPLVPILGVGVLGAAAVAAFLVFSNGGDDGKSGSGDSAVGSPTAAVSATTVAQLPLAVLNGPAADRNGLLFISDRDGQEEIYVMNADGTNQTRLTTGTRGNRLPDVTADGSRIAFVSERNGGSELYIMNGDGTDQKLIPTTEGIKLEPNFSPDGKRIVFEVKRGDNFDLYVINVDGTGLVNITNSVTADIDPVWSSLGNLVFGSDRDGNMDIYVSQPDGTGARRININPAFEGEPEWSPDGKRIVFSSYRNGNFDLYIVNDDGSNLTRLTSDPRDELDPAWSPDGQSIAYSLTAGTTTEIYVIGAGGGQARALTANTANDYKPAWTIVRRP